MRRTSVPGVPQTGLCVRMLALAALLCPSILRAGPITDVYGFDVPATGMSAVIGMVAAGDAGYLVTVGEIYRMSLGGQLRFQKVAAIPVSFGITQQDSVVGLAPGEVPTFVYHSRYGRGHGISEIKPFPPESARTLVLHPWYNRVSDSHGQWMATDTQYTWLARPDMPSAVATNPVPSPAGIYRVNMSDYSYTAFGQSGVGQISQTARAIARSLEGLLYVLDYGNLRISTYDPYSGEFLRDFAIPAETSPTALAHANGRLYTANGNGGGWIYDASTGALLGQFQATTAFPAPTHIESTVLAATSDGAILLADPNTGYHAFYDTTLIVPEPSTAALLLIGSASLVFLRWRRRQP